MAADRTTLEQGDVIDLLAHLHDRSLIALDEGKEPRYRLLETVRQYARDLLIDDQESKQIFEKHLEYYAQLAEVCEPKLKAHAQLEALALLEKESENLRVALERGTSGEGSERVMQLTADLLVFWWRMGHFAEGTEWCIRALATKFGQRRTIYRARVLNGAGLLYAFQAECMKSKELFEESRSILKDIGDDQYLAEALCGIGFSLFFLDDYTSAEKFLTEAYDLAKAKSDPWYMAWSGYMRGIIWRINGKFEDALHAYEEAINRFRKLGDRISASYPTYDIGLANYYQGNLDAAHRFLQDSLDIRRETNDAWGVSESLFGLGLVAIAQDNYQEARKRLTESKTVAKEIGDKTRVAICAHWLAHIALEGGETNDARLLHEESFAIYESLEDRWGLAHCLAGYAAMAAREGAYERAITLWSASNKLREDINSPVPPIERTLRENQVEQCRQLLGDPGRFDAAVAAGLHISLEDALALATHQSVSSEGMN